MAEPSQAVFRVCVLKSPHFAEQIAVVSNSGYVLESPVELCKNRAAQSQPRPRELEALRVGSRYHFLRKGVT